MEDGEDDLGLCFFEGLYAVLHKYIVGQVLLQDQEVNSVDAIKRFDFDNFLQYFLLLF